MLKVLFVCTHNRCRSILSEAITNHIGDGVINAKSAGSQPVGEVHPLSIKYLSQLGFATQGLKSESWKDFETFSPDVVITVCDSAAGESCPLYLGNAIKLHWGLSDPSKSVGSDSEIEEAFTSCIAIIEARSRKLVEIVTNKTSTRADYRFSSHDFAAVEAIMSGTSTTVTD
jgi:arsenate reductase